MSNIINFGNAKYIVTSKITNKYLSESLSDNDKQLTTDFFETIKESEILKKQFSVYNNIENKKVKNDILASKYIDNNISTFENVKYSDFIKENNKLKKFIDESIAHIPKDKKTLYESIYNLIVNNLDGNQNINIDQIHDSYENVLNSLMEEVVVSDNNNNKREIIDESINKEMVLDMAVKLFNKKYLSENVSDINKTIINSYISNNDEKLKELFENIKSETISKIEKIINEADNDSINKTLNKLNLMEFNKDTFIDDYYKITQLRDGLS